jgi:hypothetical protein
MGLALFVVMMHTGGERGDHISINKVNTFLDQIPNQIQHLALDMNTESISFDGTTHESDLPDNYK